MIYYVLLNIHYLLFIIHYVSFIHIGFRKGTFNDSGHRGEKKKAPSTTADNEENERLLQMFTCWCAIAAAYEHFLEKKNYLLIKKNKVSIYIKE